MGRFKIRRGAGPARHRLRPPRDRAEQGALRDPPVPGRGGLRHLRRLDEQGLALYYYAELRIANMGTIFFYRPETRIALAFISFFIGSTTTTFRTHTWLPKHLPQFQ